MRNKLWVGGITLVAAVALVLGIYGAVFATNGAQASQVQSKGKISVSGEGTVHARPDTAYITLGFTGRNTSVTAAQQEAARHMDAVISKVKSLGVADKDIQTTGYDIYRDDEHNVFVVSNTVTVTVRDIQKSGKLLDEAVKAGANSLQGVGFGIENKSDLEKQARQKALENARQKAAQLAQFGGVQLGKPVAISEDVGDIRPYPVEVNTAAGGASSSDARTPVEPGQMDVTVHVQVSYAIE